MWRRASVVLVAAILTLSAAPAYGSKTYTVTAASTGPVWRWDPPTLEIARGDAVVWKNPTDAGHHVTPYAGPWGDDVHLHLDSGGKARFRFAKKGVYKYRCDVQGHSFMVGDECLGQCGEITVR